MLHIPFEYQSHQPESNKETSIRRYEEIPVNLLSCLILQFYPHLRRCSFTHAADPRDDEMAHKSTLWVAFEWS